MEFSRLDMPNDSHLVFLYVTPPGLDGKGLWMGREEVADGVSLDDPEVKKLFWRDEGRCFGPSPLVEFAEVVQGRHRALRSGGLSYHVVFGTRPGGSISSELFLEFFRELHAAAPELSLNLEVA